MLDRLSRAPVAASEPEMAPDPYAWVDTGAAP
jgi:hypothetical protein